MALYAVFLPPAHAQHEAKAVLLPLGACGKTATTLGVLAEYLSRTFPPGIRMTVVAAGALLGGVLPAALRERGLLMRGYRRVAVLSAADEASAEKALRAYLNTIDSR